MKKWRTIPNPNKSHLIIFNHKVTNSSPSINLLQQTLQPSLSCKYLGINIDSKLNFKLHTKLCKQSIISRTKHFRSLTYKNEGINTSTACKIYKMICRPILEYGFILFGNCRKPALHNIEVGERSSLRKITKIRHLNNPLHNPSNNLLYQKTQIEPILSRFQRLAQKFANNAFNTDLINPLIHQMNPNITPKRIFPTQTIYESLMVLHNRH